MSNRIGQLLGNYRLVRLLGQGGFSDVYLGEHIHLNTYAAIKVLHAQLAEDGIDAFRTEARILAHLKHPNIVQVLDFGVDGLTPYLTMQYASNGTLRQRHARRVPVELNVVISYIQQVTSALQYAHHQKLIHRDIKPENMLIGEQNQILLSDFGIAIMTTSARTTPSATDGSWNAAGTVSYMAPEQIQGHTVPASDQYALATVVYEWLTGMLPFHGSYMEVVSQQIAATPAPLREKVPTIPADIEQIVLIALQKDPQRRFGSIEAFSNALTQTAQSIPLAVVTTTPPTTSEVSENMEAALIGPLGRTVVGTTKLTLGRAPSNTLVLSDPQVSPYHAEIRPEGGQYILVDLGTTNGTFVNEQRIAAMSRFLQAKDMLRIGDTKFTFEIHDSSQRAFYASDSANLQAMPPSPPTPPISNPAHNTAYGIGNAYPVIPFNDQNTFPASPTTPTPVQPQYPQQPPLHTPFVSETQKPTYINSSYGQPGQQPPLPQYTPVPPPYISAQQPPHISAQQPLYISAQQPPHISAQQPPYISSPQLPPQLQLQQRKKSPLRFIIIGVLAFLIILGSVLGFFGYHNYQIGQDNIHTTATARTASQNATTTAQAISQQATTVAIASATAVATSQYPPFMQVAINDALTVGTDWGGTTSSCQTSSAGLQISIQQTYTFQSCFHTGQFSDLAFQATMSITQGDCGGLDFRDVGDKGFFFFRVCQDGTYNVGVNTSTNTILLYKNGEQASSAIQQGLNKQNTLGVTVQGDTINIYINGKNIDHTTDSDLTANPQGRISLFAEDRGNPTTVVFSRALVWTMV